MTDKNVIINELNGLLTKCYDGEKGFKNAEENSNIVELINYFKAKSNQRNRFANELKTEIERLDGTPEIGGSVAGTAHRFWMDLSVAFSTENEETILDACETGEKAALEEYDHLLKEHTMDAETRQLLTYQRGMIASTLRTVEALEDMVD